MNELRPDILTSVDPPRHTFLRKVASAAFTPKAITRLEQHVADLAVAQIDRIEPGVEMDFIEAVAAPVPMRVIAEMLGVSTDLLDDFRRWSDAFIELNDQNDVRDDAETNVYFSAIMEFGEYFTAELQDRAKNPRDDLLTAVAHADDDGEPLGLESQLSMAFVLLVAGNETTLRAPRQRRAGPVRTPRSASRPRERPEPAPQRGRGVPPVPVTGHAHVSDRV